MGRKRDWWVENMNASEGEEYPHDIIDLGYIKHPTTRQRCDRLLALGIGKRNVQIDYVGRVLVRIPPSKVKRILAACRGIRKKVTYSWCTHAWIPKGANDLKYALR